MNPFPHSNGLPETKNRIFTLYKLLLYNYLQNKDKNVVIDNLGR